MTNTKLKGNYNNKLDDYKNQGISKTQKHCLRFIHAYSQDPDEEELNQSRLAEHAKGISQSTIQKHCRELKEKGFVETLNQNKLTLTEKGVKQL